MSYSSSSSIIIITILSIILSTTATQNIPPQHLSPNIPPSLLHASEALANNHHLSMSLTLELIAPHQLPISFPPTSLTIFAPSDSSFAAKREGIHQLLLHFSPVYLSPESLRSIKVILTLSSTSIVVTDVNESGVFVNNVAIAVSPVYDDGSVVVYKIDDFFEDLSFIRLNNRHQQQKQGV